MAAAPGEQTPAHDSAARDGTALLIIDMVNCFDFPGAEKLKPNAERATDGIATLLAEAREKNFPIIYVNDNFGEWHSERSKLIEAAEDQADSPRIASIRPHDGDYFIIKPHFSGFYATNLPVLLPKLGVTKLVLTGVATDICVLFTAADAHMRDYGLWIPEDAVAAEDPAREQWALDIMREAMSAETCSTTRLTMSDWHARDDAQSG